jgi:hypothetical protein
MLKKYMQTNLPPINFVMYNEPFGKNIIIPEASFVRFFLEEQKHNHIISIHSVLCLDSAIHHLSFFIFVFIIIVHLWGLR